MADWVQLCAVALDGFGQRVHAVKDWHAPTPDTDWDVTDLVKHVVGEQQWVRPLTSGLSLEDAAKQVHDLGDDLVDEWDRYSAEALAAWRMAPADGTVELSYGAVPIEHYLREMTIDAAVHTWDLARAIGGSERLDADLVRAAWESISPKVAELQESGLFAAPVPVDDDADLQDRLIAATGRNPAQPT